ncbi:MAG: PLxRFG domain-containing protein [Desulfobacterium sp.]|nr:PLxRFG domain-containing protein [Desulfobacterium sp.]
MKYDYAGAKTAGIQDSEISDLLAQEKPDYDLEGARAAGVDEGEIARLLSGVDETEWQRQEGLARERQFNLETKGDTVRGLESGLDATQGSFYGATGLAGSLLKKIGAEKVGQSIQDWGMEGYKRNVDEAFVNPTLKLGDIEGPGSAVDWAQGVFGSLFPSMVTAAAGTLTGAGVAGVAAKTVFKKAIKEMAEEGVKRQIASGVIKAELKDAAMAKLSNAITKKAMNVAGKSGMGAAVLPMEAGSNYADLLETHGIDAPLSSLGFGVLATALEYTGGNARLIDEFIGAVTRGEGRTIKKAALEILKGSSEEALQESGQEVFSILNTVVNTDEQFLTKKNMGQLFEAAAAGAMGGMGGGVVSQANSLLRPEDAASTDPAISDAADEQNKAEIEEIIDAGDSSSATASVPPPPEQTVATPPGAEQVLASSPGLAPPPPVSEPVVMEQAIPEPAPIPEKGEMVPGAPVVNEAEAMANLYAQEEVYQQEQQDEVDRLSAEDQEFAALQAQFAEQVEATQDEVVLPDPDLIKADLEEIRAEAEKTKGDPLPFDDLPDIGQPAGTKPGPSRDQAGTKPTEGEKAKSQAGIDDLESRIDNLSEAIKADMETVKSEPEPKKLAQGDAVRWQNKKKKEFTGKLLQRVGKSWIIEKLDGKKARMGEKGLTLIDPGKSKSTLGVKPEKQPGSTPQDIQTAAHKIAGAWSTRVMISDLRKSFPNTSREEFDAKLKKMQSNGELQIYPLDDPREHTSENVEGGIQFGGQTNHIVYVPEPVKQPSKKKVEPEQAVKAPNAPKVSSESKDITTNAGTPYKYESGAKLAIKKAKTEETHEPVQVDGGWIGRAKVSGQKAKPSDIPGKPSEQPATKIEDFGEKIGGARKDYATSLEDAKNLDTATHPLSKTFPEPKYDDLLKKSVDPYIVGAIRAMRDEIPNKPRQSWKLKEWSRQVELLRSTSEKLLNDRLGQDKFKGRVLDSPGIPGIIGGRAKLYSIVGHGKSLKGVTLAKHHYAVYKGEKNVTKWTVEKKAKATGWSNWPRVLAEGKTEQEAIDNFVKNYESFKGEGRGGKKVKFQLYTYRKDPGKKWIGKKVGRNTLDLKSFNTTEEAKGYLENNYDDLVDLLKKAKYTPDVRRKSNEERVGTDYRGGKDVTPEMFSDAFGFRGVEFGNWVSKTKERQMSLNNAFDALSDLADILGIPTKAISLNGELGLAFGARGSGGKNAAAAHYEPGKVVINLTKKEGAGSLAHEWWHALDNYFSRSRNYPGDFLSERPIQLGKDKQIRQEMVDAFKGIVTAYKATEIENRSAKLDRKRSKPYWNTGAELSARVFESYTIDKLAEQGHSNDYLANIVDELGFTTDMAENMFNDDFSARDFYPYLTDSEKVKVNDAFGRFFKAIKVKKTDKGEALYSTRPIPPGQAVTLQDIQNRFKGQTVTLNDDGSVSVRLKNGAGLKIKSVHQVAEGRYLYTMDAGKMDQAGVIAGKYQNNEIELVEGVADGKTMDHEVEHWLEDIGLITKTDQAAMDARIRLLDSKDKLGFKLVKDQRENRANFLSKYLADREQFRGTTVGRTLQKIADFLDAVLHLGQASVRGIAREVESGRVYDRPAGTAKDGGIQYSTVDPDTTPYDEEIKLSFNTAKDFLTGVFKNRKDKGKNYKDDLSAAALTFGSPLHNADKMGGAFGRLYNFIRQGPDIKFMKQNDLWKEGDHSMLSDISELEKKSKIEYARVKKYLRHNDINQIGPKVMQEGDKWVAWTEKNTAGKRTGIGTFEKEHEARITAINHEVDNSGFSDAGKAALRSFRKIALNNYYHFAEGMEDVIKKYDQAGMPLPQITMPTQDGFVKVSLEVAQKMLGDHTGYYFPRLRQSGEWQLFAKKKGKSNINRYFDSKKKMDGFRNIYEKKGYTVTAEKVGLLSEDVFQSLSPLLAQEAVFNRALEGVKSEHKYRTLEDLGLKMAVRKGQVVVEGSRLQDWMDAPMEALGGKYDPKLDEKGFMPRYTFENQPENLKEFEERVTKALMESSGMQHNIELEFAKAFVKEYDAVLKSHGSRARMIGRSEAKGLDVAQGYETDPHIAIAQLSQATAGGYAKKQIAENGIKIISGQDISWQEFKAKNGDVADLEKKLESEDLSTPEQKVDKKKLRRELGELRKGLWLPLSPNELERTQKRIFEVSQELKLGVNWRDKTKARKIKQELAQKKVSLWQEWQAMVKERRIDPARQNKMYADTTTLLQDILKNEEATDRLIGALKGVAVWQYLGFRVSSPAVNMTNMVMAVPAVMSSRGGVPLHKALVHVGKAGKQLLDHRRGKATGEVKQVFDEISERGWDEPKFNREAFDALQSRLGKGWSWLLEKSMWMFGVTEKINRATSISAAYFAMKEQNTGKWDHEKMMEKAKDISDHAHGEYGKANRPYHMRGKNVGARVLQMSYVFQTFSHNYIQEMAAMGLKKKDYGAALWMALSPAVIGGIGATVPIGIAKAISNAFGGDDPEEMVISAVKQLLGEDSETFMRYGAAGLVGVSLKGSLAQRFGVPEKFVDIFGAPGAVVGDVFEGVDNITKGFYREGFEKMAPAFAQNISRGLRENSEGVTTRSGSPVFWGNDPLKADTIDMVMRFLSFNPVGIAGKREVQWKEYLKQNRFKGKKSDINKRFKRFYSKPQRERSKKDYVDLMADVRDFNETIKRKGLGRIVSPITNKSIKASLRSLKPRKSERER